MKTIYRAVSVFVICLLLATSAHVVRAQDDIVAAAKKEANLTLYLSMNLTDANGLMQLFR